MAGRELPQEQRVTLLRMGFEDIGDGGFKLANQQMYVWPYTSNQGRVYIADWQADESAHHRDNPRFDDPITAATWLLIQASNHG